MNTSIPRLILHPKDGQYIADNMLSILQQLKSIHFISQITNDSSAYLAGNEFINLLAFLGCSPDINLSPEDGDNFCSITITDCHENITLLGYTSMITPGCPKCKHKVSDWKQHFHDWKKGDHIYSCSKCQVETTVNKLKWRHEAGYGRCCISINHIHPHEAVPSEKLLNALQLASNTEWTYFYANN